MWIDHLTLQGDLIGCMQEMDEGNQFNALYHLNGNKE